MYPAVLLMYFIFAAVILLASLALIALAIVFPIILLIILPIIVHYIHPIAGPSGRAV